MLAPAQTRTPLTPYHRRLFVLLSVATFFEGFDYIALTQILPSIRGEYGLDFSAGQFLVAVINVGAFFAYALIRRADVVGRKPVLSLTIAGYTIFSLLSALALGPVQFGLAQLCARAFLLAEYAVSMVYVVEEFPADRRAFAVGVVQGVNALGGIVCAGLVPILLKSPWGFRSIYAIGAVPLLLVMFLRRNVRETARFLAQTERPRADLFRIFRTPHRRRIPLLATIWALIYLCTYPVVNNFKEFAVADRNFDDRQVALAVMIAALGSLPLVFASGKLLDKIGRKRGAVVIFTCASVSTCIAYLGHGFAVLTLGLTLAIFSASAVLPVLNSFTLELFPTDLRADGYGWSNNLLGRIGYVLGPVLIGLAKPFMGLGPAMAATAVFPLLALALVLTRLPETSGKELEETSALH